MKPHDPQHGRSDSVRVTRRAALRLAGALGLSHSVLGGVVLGRQEGAAERRPTLVTVFLRGGLDGLNLIVPHGEEAYYRLRPQLAIPRPAGDGTAVDLDGFFGLHPAAAAWKPWFDSGAAAAVHAVGTASNTRSHFEEQDRWETAVEGATLEATGWLNRYLATTGGPGPVRALALGDSLPRALRGDVTTLALRVRIGLGTVMNVAVIGPATAKDSWPNPVVYFPAETPSYSSSAAWLDSPTVFSMTSAMACWP